MMNDQYFRLEANVMSDDRIYALLEELGMKGFGIYMALLIELRQRDNYVCAISSLKSLARKWCVSLKTIERVLQGFGLFRFRDAKDACTEIDDASSFYSPYLNKVMVALEKRRKAGAGNGEQGGRPSQDEEVVLPHEDPESESGDVLPAHQEEEEDLQGDAGDSDVVEDGVASDVEKAMTSAHDEDVIAIYPEPKKSDSKSKYPCTKGFCGDEEKPGNKHRCNLVEKSRVKQSKVENIDFVDRKEEKNVSAAAALKVSTAGKGGVSHVAAVADEALAPFRPWEEHVDEMEKVQTWMELMGMHSGMGRMFLDNRQRIVALFKEHVRLYAKESSITSPDAARNYFSHWIRAGSPSQRTLYARLQSELQSHSADDPYVYEQRDPLTGARSYCGLPIPPGSPPRPSPNAVWSDAIKKWSS